MRQKKKNNIQSKISQIDQEIEDLRRRYDGLDEVEIKGFKDFPLSQKTKDGLNHAKYINPTPIQKATIGLALKGNDILAAAITGSGKTLAFLIPVLEHLYVKKWSRMDGIGAIIISPTRELAYQIFETLRKIGHFHDFSAGLIIGGKNLHFEKNRMDQCNILICTPGRLLQHMDENPLFNANSMEMLVLDEADRCLDMGFETALNAIIDNLPPDRQTLLFSATQTSSVKDLARLNLRSPVCVGTTINSKEPNGSTALAIPEQLQQSYVVVELEDKITVLWSFIKNHLKQKIIVFLTSCKQVKYIHEIFCKLRPGISLLALYGTLHQDRRISIYNEFMRKNHVVLFATDIASRGLDFPSVSWVVQLDCPEDVTQYIHRAGRSARNSARGESLLVLMPSEEQAMIENLKERSIDIPKLHIDPKKLFSPRVKIEGFLAQNIELKASAQRAFVAYIKSIFLMKNKRVFNVNALNLDAFAKSLGLVVTPRVRFLEKFHKEKEKKKSGALEKHKESEDKLPAITSNHSADSDSSEDEDFFKVTRRDHEIPDIVESPTESDLENDAKKKRKAKALTKTSMAKKTLKKKVQVNQILKFDESGKEIFDDRRHMHALRNMDSDLQNDVDGQEDGGIDLEITKKLLSIEDQYDKERFRALVKARHKQQREKSKQQRATNVESQDSSDEDSEYSESSDGSSVSDNSEGVKEKRSAFAKKDSQESDENENSEDSSFEQPPTKMSKVTSKLSLDDAEAIAAQLLSNYS